MNESAWLFIRVLINEFAWLLIRIVGLCFVGLLIMQIDVSIRDYKGDYNCHRPEYPMDYDDYVCSDNVKYSRLLFLSASAYYFLRRGKFVHSLLINNGNIGQ
jgi:hypothetical protein